MRFCAHVPNSTRNKNVRFSKPYLSPKIGFFGPRNTAVPLGHSGKNIFFGFEPYDLAMVRNECLRFGGHVSIQVSYKILRL
jgi:hypothetical protein